MNSDRLYEELGALVSKGELFALATIVRTAGSSPRRAGAKMIIFPGGKISGTIGGGKLEATVIAEALDLIGSTEGNRLKTFRFTKSGPDAIGMTCGGEADLFIEVFRGPLTLFIFGGGHIGRELIRLAIGSGFSSVLIDDRSEILECYDAVITTHMAGENFETDLPEISDDAYVVIVTRSHKTDTIILRGLINKELTYLGMMGSKAKISKIFIALKEDGFEQAALDRIHTPIGLDIKAEGPYEIALSIMAELIAVRNGLTKS